MDISTVQPSDRAEWLRMRHSLWPDEDQEDLASDADGHLGGHGPYAVVLVARRAEGGLCGFLELSVRSYAEGCDGPTPYVEGWYVDRDSRVRGVGRALMGAAESWARERGYGELASDAVLENVASHGAHLALGFEEVERLVVFRKVL